jgi:hypothetical protein
MVYTEVKKHKESTNYLNKAQLASHVRSPQKSVVHFDGKRDPKSVFQRPRARNFNENCRLLSQHVHSNLLTQVSTIKTSSRPCHDRSQLATDLQLATATITNKQESDEPTTGAGKRAWPRIYGLENKREKRMTCSISLRLILCLICFKQINN